ncbi:hypothetical protein [Pseudomonas atacamensis]|jgi:hypothetical protein|uniref:hypothetical protein n=1 Tax=Pseudomonas atacamensis TaxID=2565368 RepID=UPI003CEB5BF0
MSQEIDGVLRRTGFAMLWPLVVGLPIALFAGGIDVAVFVAVATLWLAVALVLIIGPDSVSEITFWKASIKRDALATRVAREEVEEIRDQLRKISATSVENTYIISGELLLLIETLMGTTNSQGKKVSLPMIRLNRNMNDVWKFVEPDPVKSELLRKQFRKDIGFVD